MSEWKPVAWMLKTGHGTKIVEVKPPCEVDLWKPLYLAPQPTEREGGMRDECKHGSLRRKCEVCDLERQLSDALEREKALRQELAIEFGNSERLAKALEGVVRVADRNTDEFNAARTALALHESGDEPTYTDCPIHGRHEGDCPRC